MELYIIIGLIAVGIGGIMFAVSLMLTGSSGQVEDRLASLTQNNGRGQAKTDKKHDSSNFLRSPLDDTPDKIEEIFSNMFAFFNLREYLQQSGTGLSVSQFVLIAFGVAFGLGLASAYFIPVLIFAPLAAFIGLLLTPLYVWFVRKKRLSKFDGQLPAALDLIGQALRAGQSLPAGIQLVGQQMDAPLGPEFRQAFEEQNLGASMTETLSRICDRVPSLDMRFFSTAVTLQRQTGGDLAEILDKIGKLMRERVMIKGQIQALTGEGRMSGIVLLSLPPSLFLFMMQINYDYIMKLIEEPLGNKMLIGAVIMQLVGAICIKKIITIKV